MSGKVVVDDRLDRLPERVLDGLERHRRRLWYRLTIRPDAVGAVAQAPEDAQAAGGGADGARPA
jgi:hypothetical protein